MVYYRKYRPQTIADLDSTAVRETLQSVLKKEVPHAFLFTGPKGLGKTSTARIVAKSVNCTGKKPGDFEPCNTCELCVSITNGTNLDVLEIDAASNRGIDEIRDLKEKIRLAPVSSKMKVYIIDEVHMLTTEAFNALLKTLEEPPAHAMFILATTEPHKVPATILSRCFHINFHLATKEEIVHALKRVTTGEKLKIDDSVLEEVAAMAEGGFRDAVKLLEELVLVSEGKKITPELFNEKFKSRSIKHTLFTLIETTASKDLNKSLEIVSQLVSQGTDIRYVLQNLIEILHAMMLAQINGTSVKEDLPQTKLEGVEIRMLVELFSAAYQETKFAVVPQLPLELAIIEWCSFTPGPSTSLRVNSDGESQILDQTSSTVVEESSTRSSVGMTGKDVTVSTLRQKVGTMKKVQAMYGAPKKVKEEGVKIETTTVELQHASGDGTVTKEWLDAFWKSLITEMKNHNHTAAGVLRSCAIKSYDTKTLVITTAYKFHKERLDEFKTKDALVKVCKMLTGKTVEVAIELKT